MIEWLDGYWTAMKHVANAAPPLSAGQESSLADWLAAGGSIAAAGAAAIAAWLSWSAAKHTRLITLEAERASLIRDAMFIRDSADKKIDSLMSIEFDNDFLRLNYEEYNEKEAEFIKEFLLGLRNDTTKYERIAKNSRQVLDEAFAMQTVHELSSLRKSVFLYQTTMNYIDNITLERQNEAKRRGVIN